MDANVITALIALAGSVLVVGLTQFLAGRNNLAQAVLADQRLAKQAAQATTRESLEAARRDKREALQWDQVAAREAAQAERAAQQDTLQWGRQQDDKQTALLMAKREAFLGYVLLARAQMEWMVHQSPICLPEAVSEHPTSVARQAYAVALLYLADMHPLAVVFYETTGRLQQALLGADDVAVAKCQAAWIQSFKAIEKVLAANQSLGL